MQRNFQIHQKHVKRDLVKAKKNFFLSIHKIDIFLFVTDLL